MAIYPMGTASSAKSQFIYVCKYIVKDPVEITSLLSFLHSAVLHNEKYPSCASDSGSDDRSTQHLLQRVLNKMCGKQEYSGNQAVAALLGLRAEFHMHTRLLYYQRVKRQEFCFGDSGVRLGVMGRAGMVDVPEATIRMGIAVDSKLE